MEIKRNYGIFKKFNELILDKMKNIIMNDINLKNNIYLHCLFKHSLNFVCIKD